MCLTCRNAAQNDKQSHYRFPTLKSLRSFLGSHVSQVFLFDESSGVGKHRGPGFELTVSGEVGFSTNVEPSESMPRLICQDLGYIG